MLRVAIVGSGPAGVYAVEALTRRGDATVDVFDRLPSPFGLVRYGVAPDHPKIRSISAALTGVLEHPDVRFLGNVDVGADITLAELRTYYDAILVASGAAVDRRLGVPGEDLPGSFSATDFVAWYNGHPDAPIDAFTVDARSVAVVGMGNVAVDVVRLLAKTADDLRSTDMPDHVLDVLDRSHVTDIHMVGRRGPVQAKFTTRSSASSVRSPTPTCLSTRPISSSTRSASNCWPLSRQLGETSRCCAGGRSVAPAAGHVGCTCGSGCDLWRCWATSG